VRDADWYLSFDVERRRDVVEYPIVDDIDCGGWDVRKALYLFTRTNGALLEWLHSPIVYIERGDLAQDLRALARQASDPVALCYHYSHMARHNAREHVFAEKVRLKKYFYVLRPLLAIRYIERGNGIPPVEFEALVEAVAPPAIRASIAALLQLKRITPELGTGDPIPEIGNFIEQELERHGELFSGQGRPEFAEGDAVRVELNTIFRKAVSAGVQGCA
jgi:predicted nucleotidyltransferase